MKQRDALLVLAAVLLAVGVSAILLVGTLSSATPGARPRVFFDGRTVPPARGIVELQRGVPEPFAALVPVQRNVSDTSRDAAGYLLVLLATAAALVLGHDQVIATYRASLGDWRRQLRVLLTGLALLALGASAAALSSIVFLGMVANEFRRGPFGIQGPVQLGFTAFAVMLVFVAIVTLVGFAAASWRLGDQVFRVRPFSRLAPQIPAPLVALIGATLIYLVWQIPIVGTIAVVGVVAYALGAVLNARLSSSPL